MFSYFRPGDDYTNLVDAFNAYVPPGLVSRPLSDLVYVNYARNSDLDEVEKILGKGALQGKICIARYGKGFRGSKITNCQARGAAAIIIFSDPHEVATMGTDPDHVYPNSIFLPEHGMQRGGTKVFKNKEDG